MINWQSKSRRKNQLEQNSSEERGGLIDFAQGLAAGAAGIPILIGLIFLMKLLF